MSSIGNNTNQENAELRDSFFIDVDGHLGSEGKYAELLNKEINNGFKFDIVNLMEFKDYYLIVRNVKQRICNNENIDNKQKARALKIWEGLTTAEISAKTVAQLETTNNNEGKRILCETLMGMVEEGVFDESHMQIVENILCLVLHSIQDLEAVMEKER